MQDSSILKPFTLTIPSPLQESLRQERYQVITSDNGEAYVLDHLENIIYPIKQPVYSRPPQSVDKSVS